MRVTFTNYAGRFFTAAAFLCLIFSGCKKHDVPQVNKKEVDMRLIADNFVSPIGFVPEPQSTDRMYVLDQVGKIYIIDGGNKLSSPFFDVTSKMVPLSARYDERGLLGLAFHPNYKNNGRFFVYYQLPPRAGGPQPGVSWNNLSRISEFRVSGDKNHADMNSERILLQWDDPQSNHNGGTLAFGPDGYLYISIGDGGGEDDVAPGHVPGGNAQNVEANLFGKILRININSSNGYDIPADNPFVGKGKGEIYAYGFRNPYRFSFDMGDDHKLIAGDAGQVLWEEIDIVKKGGNYGWNVKEGTHCFNPAHDTMILPNCTSVDRMGNPLVDPVIEIKNWANPLGGKATAIIGGNVYRGNLIDGWNGKYIFGTLSQTPTTANGQLFMAHPSSFGMWSYDQISLKSHPDDIGYYLKGFGQDNIGEIYLTVSSQLGVTGTTGKVYELVQVKDKNGF
jgi:glucose/arabinose dehydrogenase